MLIVHFVLQCMFAIITRILLGMGIAGLGFIMVLRTRWFIDFFGYFDYMDQKLGPGGTNLFYKLLGTLVCFIGFMVSTNLWDAFVASMLGSVVPKR